MKSMRMPQRRPAMAPQGAPRPQSMGMPAPGPQTQPQATPPRLGSLKHLRQMMQKGRTGYPND